MTNDSTITTAILKLEAAAYAIQNRRFTSAVQLLQEVEQLARAARHLIQDVHQAPRQGGD